MKVPLDRWRNDAFYDPTPGMPGKSITKRGGFVPRSSEFDADFFDISPRGFIISWSCRVHRSRKSRPRSSRRLRARGTPRVRRAPAARASGEVDDAALARRDRAQNPRLRSGPPSRRSAVVSGRRLPELLFAAAREVFGAIKIDNNIEEADGKSVYLPIAAKRMRVFGAMPRNSRVRAKIRKFSGRDLVIDYDMSDKDGNIVAGLTDFALRATFCRGARLP